MSPPETPQREGRMERFVIVNADDFGLTSGINRGIIEAHEHGIVTSASLMVRSPAAREAAAYAKYHAELSVGLHFDLGEWRYRSGEWERVYEVVCADDGAAVAAELERQLATFHELLGRRPTHIDSHQHTHLSDPVRSVAMAVAARLGVPLRACGNRIRYSGGFYGQTAQGAPFPSGISPSHLLYQIASVAAGWTEIACHPGYGAGLDSVYRAEREEEIRVLCRAEVRDAFREEEVLLRSFRDLSEIRS